MRWTYELAEIVDGVAEESGNAKIVCTLETLIGGHVLLEVLDTGEVEQRVAVVRCVLGFGLKERISTLSRSFPPLMSSCPLES